MKNKSTKARLKQIASLEEFDELLNKSTLSDVDKQGMRLHYIQDKSLGYIADEFGYSESCIKKRHAKCLQTIEKIID